MNTYRIVKRAFSEYTEIETVEGWVNAMERASILEFTHNDGEYLVLSMDEPNKTESTDPYFQSGLDYL